ncbi:MAG: DNA primase, partial [Clostridia bacterium]
MLSESFLQELRDKNDIEDTISRYVELKKAGKNIKGLCPFHSEKTASFTVFPDTQSFFCFCCNAGGDVITFIKKIENLDYIDAVRLLADKAHIELPKDNISDESHKLRTRIYEMNTIAAKFFHNNLKLDFAKVALQYINKRALLPETVTKFGLGYALDKWDGLINHLKEKGYYLEEMQAAGLVVKNDRGTYYDRFRNKLIFPIIDLKGKVIGFGGRVLDDSKPKYLNSPETLIFKKGTNLFALSLAKNENSDTIILAEGYMDVIAMHQAGIKTAVATLGT